MTPTNLLGAISASPITQPAAVDASPMTKVIATVVEGVDTALRTRAASEVADAIQSATSITAILAAIAADPGSAARAVAECYRRGLSLDPRLGHAYLAARPDGRGVHLALGYRGMISLARADGARAVYAEVVHEADLFVPARGTRPSIKHLPNYLARDRGPIVAAYAVVVLDSRERDYEVCPLVEIEIARSRSALTEQWSENFPAMAKAYAIRQLLKRTALSTPIHDEERRQSAPTPPPAASTEAPVGADDTALQMARQAEFPFSPTDQ